MQMALVGGGVAILGHSLLQAGTAGADLVSVSVAAPSSDRDELAPGLNPAKAGGGGGGGGE